MIINLIFLIANLIMVAMFTSMLYFMVKARRDGIRSTICEYGRGCEKEAYALAEKITLFLAGE